MIEGSLRLASMVVTVLIIAAVIALALGREPKECPPHICLPKSKIVSAEQLLAARAEAEKSGNELPMGSR